MINDLNEKKTLLLNKYGQLFRERTGYDGVMLDNYVNVLIQNGEKYYGANFIEDILKEKRNDSIIWLMDEIARNALAAQPTAAPAPVQAAPTNDMQLKEQWVQYLMTAGMMTEVQARNYAADPNNQVHFDEWLRQSQTTPALPPAGAYNLPEPPALSDPIPSEELTMETKKQILLSHHEDEIKKRVFGSRFTQELNPIQKSELDSSLEEIIKNGELHYGENFVKDFANVTAKEEIEKILRSLPIHPVNDVAEEVTTSPEPINQTVTASEPTTTLVSDEQPTEPLPNIEETVTPEPSVTPMAEQPTQPIPATARKGKRKEAPQSLFQKLKEKWHNASFKKKVLIVAVAAAAGIALAAGVFAMATSGDTSQMQTAVDVVNNTDPSVIANMDPSAANSVDPNAVVDYSNIGPGTDVHYTQADAMSGNNMMTGNEYMAADHAEFVNQNGEVTNLDGLTNDQVNQVLNSDEGAVRVSAEGEWNGWQSEKQFINSTQNQSVWR